MLQFIIKLFRPLQRHLAASVLVFVVISFLSSYFLIQDRLFTTTCFPFDNVSLFLTLAFLFAFILYGFLLAVAAAGAVYRRMQDASCSHLHGAAARRPESTDSDQLFHRRAPANLPLTDAPGFPLAYAAESG